MCSVTWLVQICTWPELFTSCLQHEMMMAASMVEDKNVFTTYLNWAVFLFNMFDWLYFIMIMKRLHYCQGSKA